MNKAKFTAAADRLYDFLSRPMRGAAVAILVKGLVLALVLANQNFSGDAELRFGSCSGDCFSYTQPVDNLLERGVYALDPLPGEPMEAYAGRMPGYAAVYLPYRAAGISKEGAMQALVLLQWLMLGASVWYLARFAEQISGSRTVFLAIYLIYAASSFAAIWALFILTEAFAVSALIFALYFLARRKSRIDYLYAGLWLCWAVFLRPYLVVVFLPLGLFALYANRGFLQKGVVAGALLLAPFLVADAAWTTRNFIAKDALIPLQSGRFAGYKSYADWELVFFEWVESWGGDAVPWNPKSEAALFYDMTKVNAPPINPKAFDRLPQSIYAAGGYNQDTALQLARDVRLLYYELEKGSASYQKLEAKVIRGLQSWTAVYRQNKPLDYHVIARLRVLKAMLFHSGTYNLFSKAFSELSLPLKAVKLGYSLLYLFVMLGGLCGGLIVLFLARRKMQAALFFSIPAGLIALFCFVFRTAEYRHLALVYPLLLVFAIWAAILVGRKVFGRFGNQSQVCSTT